MNIHHIKSLPQVKHKWISLILLSIHSSQHQEQYCTKNINRRIIQNVSYRNTVKLSYDVMKGTEYFVLLQVSVVLTDWYIVMVNSEDLTGTTEYLML